MINQMDYQRLYGPYHVLHLNGDIKFSWNTKSAKAGAYKDQDFPEYMVDVTKNTLVTISDSVNKASTQSYLFFSQLCQYYAFERISRQFAAFGLMPSCGIAGMGNNSLWPLPAPNRTRVRPAAFRIDQRRVQAERPAATISSAPTESSTPKNLPAEDPIAAACAAFTAITSAFFAMPPITKQAGNIAG